MKDLLPEESRSAWPETGGGLAAAEAYQQHFDDLAAAGVDIHGEANFIASLVQPPARILDAGCGTGRVATQLTALGFHCVGVDSDPDMIAVAEQRDPWTRWVCQDLTRLQLAGQAFNLAVLAGNVVPLLAPGSLQEVVNRVAAHLQPGGLLVSGFGLDEEHLPPGVPVTPLEDYDRACEVAGLSLLHHRDTWESVTWSGTTGYVVAVHRLND